MDRFQQVWGSLQDEEYRREYSADVGTGLAFQIKLLREKNGWTQQQLAERAGGQQETISQWENPNYGSYTLNSLKSLAAAFDVALMVKFAPFSELVEWSADLTPERLAPPSFTEEQRVQPKVCRVAYEPIFVTATSFLIEPRTKAAPFPDTLLSVSDLLEAYAQGLNTASVKTLKSALLSEGVSVQPRADPTHVLAA